MRVLKTYILPVLEMFKVRTTLGTLCIAFLKKFWQFKALKLTKGQNIDYIILEWSLSKTMYAYSTISPFPIIKIQFDFTGFHKLFIDQSIDY